MEVPTPSAVGESDQGLVCSPLPAFVMEMGEGGPICHLEPN